MRVMEAAHGLLAAIVVAAAEGRVEEAAHAFLHLSRAKINGDETILDRLMLEERMIAP